MFRKSTDESKLEQEIERATSLIARCHPGTKEFQDVNTYLNLLYKAKEHEAPDRISKDTIAVIVGNLTGIGMIIAYERVHVVTSKALGFVMKAR